MSNLRMKTPIDIDPSDDPDIIDIQWMRIVVSPYSRFFWEGCAQRELRLPKCGACGNIWFYPTPRCTRCLEPAGEWVVSSGRGALYSYTTVYRALHPELAAEVPYVVAVVALEEGVRLMANLRATSDEDLQIDMPVRVDFRKLKTGALLPFFVPDR